MTLYRYNDAFWSDSQELDLVTFTLVKETPCGYWVKEDSGWDEKQKFVLKTSRKRLCYPTKEEALTSYIARKKRQILIQTGQIEKAKKMLALALTKINMIPVEKSDDLVDESDTW